MFRSYMFEEKPKAVSNRKEKTKKANCQFPNEIWVMIVSFLPKEDLFTLLLVNKYLNAIATQRIQIDPPRIFYANLSTDDYFERILMGYEKSSASDAVVPKPAVKKIGIFSFLSNMLLKPEIPTPLPSTTMPNKQLTISKMLFNLFHPKNFLGLTDKSLPGKIFLRFYNELKEYCAVNNGDEKFLVINFCANARRACAYCTNENIKKEVERYIGQLIHDLKRNNVGYFTHNGGFVSATFNDMSNDIAQSAEEFSKGAYRPALPFGVKSYGQQYLEVLLSDQVWNATNLEKEDFTLGIVQLCALVGTPADLKFCLSKICKYEELDKLIDCFYAQSTKATKKCQPFIAAIISDDFSFCLGEWSLGYYNADCMNKLLSNPLMMITTNLERHNKIEMVKYLTSKAFVQHGTWKTEFPQYLAAALANNDNEIQDILTQAYIKEHGGSKEILIAEAQKRLVTVTDTQRTLGY